MKKGRTAASDGVTVEMLSQLSDHHLGTLADAFSIRSASPVETGDSAPTVPGWHKLASYLIPKKHPVRLFKDLRPITIIPVLRKLYLRLLLARMNIKLQEATPDWCMACKAGVSAAEPLLLIRQLVERHLEWDQSLHGKTGSEAGVREPAFVSRTGRT